MRSIPARGIIQGPPERCGSPDCEKHCSSDEPIFKRRLAVTDMSQTEYTSITTRAETADKLYERKRRNETWDEFFERQLLDE